MRWTFSGNRLRRQGQIQWAPTLTSHDPNPPITLESAVGGNIYNESIAFSSTPTYAASPLVDFFPSLAAFGSTPSLSPVASADLLGGVNLVSTPAFSAINIADLFDAVTFLSNPALSVANIADLLAGITLLSSPAITNTAILDILLEIIFASDPSLAAVGGFDFYNEITLASDPAFTSALLLELLGIISLSSSPSMVLVEDVVEGYYNPGKIRLHSEMGRWHKLHSAISKKIILKSKIKD